MKIKTRHQLFKALALAMTELRGERVTIKAVRAAFDKWRHSTMPQAMSFGEFLLKVY